jgi:hypothetical protein
MKEGLTKNTAGLQAFAREIAVMVTTWLGMSRLVSSWWSPIKSSK